MAFDKHLAGLGLTDNGFQVESSYIMRDISFKLLLVMTMMVQCSYSMRDLVPALMTKLPKMLHNAVK